MGWSFAKNDFVLVPKAEVHQQIKKSMNFLRHSLLQESMEFKTIQERKTSNFQLSKAVDLK
jgi:hypothetical protein